MIQKIETSISLSLRSLIFPWIVIAVLTSSVSPAVAQEQNTVSSLLWSICDDASDMECAKLPVPVDWNNPQGEKIDISLVRLRASVADAPTLLLGPGGPGESGVENMKSGVWGKHLDRLKMKGLVNAVSWDSRGIGESSPVMCDPDRPRKNISLNDEEITDGELTVAREKNRSYVQGCREKTGAIFDHIDTMSDVHDMEAIRAALGLKKLNYLGYSYGSLRGQQYVSTYPLNVGRFVLDSVTDHSVTGLKAYAEIIAQGPENQVKIFFDWCASHTGCALHGREGEVILADLYGKAENGELIDPDTQGKMTVRDLALMVSAYTMDPVIGQFEEFANYLAHLAGYLPAGNVSSVKPSIPEKESLFKSPYVLNFHALNAIKCADWGVDVNTAQSIRDIKAGLAQAAPFTKAWQLSMTTPVRCVGFPQPTNPPAPVSFKDAPQVMIISALGDIQTPYDWGVSLAKKTNTPLLTYGGYSHITYMESACTASHIHDYLLNGVLLNGDFFCPSENIYPGSWLTMKPGAVKAEISKMSLAEARSGTLVAYNKTGLVLPLGKTRFVVRMGLNNGAIGSYVDTTKDTGMLKIRTNPNQGPGVYKIVLAATDGSATAQGNIDVGTPIYVTITP